MTWICETCGVETADLPAPPEACEICEDERQWVPEDGQRYEIIYGALHHPVPADAPPAFIATSADDGLLQAAAIPMFQAWRAAGRPAELHLYEKGGHGWGMSMKGSTSDHWFDEFVWWMQARGLTGAKR